MENRMLKLRYFLLGFVPTLCAAALIWGLAAVWLNTSAALMPELPSLSVEAVDGGVWKITAFGGGRGLSLPADRVGEGVSRFPGLVPRELRLLAWGIDALGGNNWKEYLRGLLPY